MVTVGVKGLTEPATTVITEDNS